MKYTNLLVLMFALVIKVDGSVFRCRDKSIIPYEMFCNGIDDCGDKSDEKYNVMTFDSFSEWQSCGNPDNHFNGLCLVHREGICRGEVICSNLNACDLKCDSYYKCQQSGECVPRSTVCNGIACDGCKEDHGWRNGVGFKCLREGRECVLPQQLLHDDVPDCDGGNDLCFGLQFPLNAKARNEFQTTDNIFRDKCFQCFNDVMLIPTSRVCDGVIDCDDLSDECVCDSDTKPEICNKVIPFAKKVNDSDHDGTKEGSAVIEVSLFRPSKPIECKVGAVQCEQETCIPRSSVCDGVRDCEDDERFQYCRGTVNCKDSVGYEKVCRCDLFPSKCEMNYGTACDGVADCPLKLPKEATNVIRENTSPEDECDAVCFKERTNFTCKRSLVPYKEERSAMIFCHVPESLRRNKTGGRKFPTSVWNERICDGYEDCELGDDEVASACPQRFICDAENPGYVSIRLDQTCDGIEDCKDGSDETEKLCGERRFRCPSLGGKRVNIAKELVCDLMITCDDESDEKNCSDERFYCENGDPLFVRERKTFDGQRDCLDWSDECPMLNQKGPKNGFSSRYELIANPFLRYLVWIMGLLSICGNATVLFIETKNLKNFKNIPACAVANRLLVLNLATSDIIMGIYLVALGIAGITLQGRYCAQDLPWRSCAACTTLGVLSVLSSETSVITLVLLTCCRLYAVLRPFDSAFRPTKGVVSLMMLSAWAVSLTVALVPLAPQLSEIFLSKAQFENTPYSRNIELSLDEARELFSTLMTYDLKPNITVPVEFSVDQLSWRNIEKMAKQFFVHEHLQIQRMFGYYSTEDVCISKFFISRSDRAWGFSFSVNLFNFCAFVFVASSYLVIYLRTRKRPALKNSTRNSNDEGATSLQRKILRLIITDYCCWIPICLMAFAKLGGANISNTTYIVSAIVIMPINSVLNPLLYSNLPDIFYKWITETFKKMRTRPSITEPPDTRPTNTRPTDKTAVDLDSAKQPTNVSGDDNKKIVNNSEDKNTAESRL